MTNNNNGLTTGQKVSIGAGAIALAATSYYLFGPEGKQHRKQAKGWMIKAKGEIIEKLEEAKDVTEPIYHGIVDSVITPYIGRGAITREEIEDFGRRLKSQWKQIYRSAAPKKKKSGGSKMKKSKGRK
jgi:hypothetical protein